MKKNLLFILMAVAQLAGSKLSFGQAPSLGTASTFSVFTAVGAIDITGVSTISGDVGTDAGAYSIASSSVVCGNIQNENSTSAQVALDVAAVYSDLVGRICGDVLVGTNGLGTQHKVLGPNTVFCLSGAQTLDGDLTLDGQSDPNAIFIIQIDGALSTNTSSRVLLVNSASFYNVFWQVNGAVELGENSIFRGTIVANGAINLLDSANLEGRAFSKAGAISLHNNIVVGDVTSGGSLPVALMSFTAKAFDDNNAILNWATACEINNDYFLVQRSEDGITVEDISSISGSGNSFLINRYSMIDEHPFEGISYYRLRQVGFDGVVSYSDFVSLNLKKAGSIKVYPNPFNTFTTISLMDASPFAECELKLYNLLGEEVVKRLIDKQNTILEADKLLSGVYLYTITSNEEVIHSGRIVLIR